MDVRAEPHALGVGVYSVQQAARLSEVPARSIHRWLLGYSYRYGDGVTHQSPVVARERSVLESETLSLTFRDLLEIRFVHAFRNCGVSWNVIRRATEKAGDLFHTDHPFTTKAFHIDGRRIFAELQSEGVRERKLVDLVSDQYAFRHVMLPSFRAQIELSERGAERWWPMGRKKLVVLDPARQFGEPIVAEGGVPTAVLAKAAAAMHSEQATAKWYEVSRAAVRQAVTFEQQLAAA
jgi:uncharacterized protein (DUF433 family)